MENSAYAGEGKIVFLPIDKIITNPYQPRKLFERNSLEELAGSIKSYGVLQPVSVRLINGCSYELVAGERRLRASKLAGLTNIPAIVINITDKDSAVIALIENLQRQDLHYLEEAEGFRNLMSDYSLTQEEMARRIGKSQSTVANKLRILKLPRQVQKLLLEHGLTERHARTLLRAPDTRVQMEILERVIKYDLTVKRTEELVEDAIKKADKPGAVYSTTKPAVRRRGNMKLCIKDIRLLANSLKKAAEMMNGSGHKTDYTVVESEEGYEFRIYVCKGAL